MKIDFHCHILPGLDDGAKCIEDSLLMAKAMKDWGFERVTCTPHITNVYRNTPETISSAFSQLKEALRANDIDLDIRMSAEYRLIPEAWSLVLKNDWLMPIEDKFILMELPISGPEPIGNLRPMEEFKKILSMGLIPILPHPERYYYLTRKELLEFADAGVMIQCNYGSLAGLYGDSVKELVHDIINEGIVSFYGTDLHNAHYVEVLSEWFASGNKIQDWKE